MPSPRKCGAQDDNAPRSYLDIEQPRHDLEVARRLALALADDEAYTQLMTSKPSTIPPRLAWLGDHCVRPQDPRTLSEIYRVSRSAADPCAAVTKAADEAAAPSPSAERLTAAPAGASVEVVDAPGGAPPSAVHYPLVRERICAMFEQNRVPVVLSARQRSYLICCYNYLGKQFTNELVNTLSHVVGAVAAIPAGVYLLVSVAARTELSAAAQPASAAARTAATAIYALSLVSCFLFSALYHGLGLRMGSWRLYKALRRLDHVGVLLLISGSFFPVCFGVSASPLFLTVGFSIGIILFLVGAVEWGTLFKQDIVSPVFFGVFQAALPVAGAAGLVGLRGLDTAVPIVSLYAAGGVCYLLGLVFFAGNFKPLVRGVVAAHEIFHFAIVLAAAMHYAAVYYAVMLS